MFLHGVITGIVHARGVNLSKKQAGSTLTQSNRGLKLGPSRLLGRFGECITRAVRLKMELQPLSHSGTLIVRSGSHEMGSANEESPFQGLCSNSLRANVTQPVSCMTGHACGMCKKSQHHRRSVQETNSFERILWDRMGRIQKENGESQIFPTPQVSLFPCLRGPSQATHTTAGTPCPREPVGRMEEWHRRRKHGPPPPPSIVPCSDGGPFRTNDGHRLPRAGT